MIIATYHLVAQIITNLIRKNSVPVNWTRELLFDLILPVGSIGLLFNNTAVDGMNL